MYLILPIKSLCCIEYKSLKLFWLQLQTRWVKLLGEENLGPHSRNSNFFFASVNCFDQNLNFTNTSINKTTYKSQ